MSIITLGIGAAEDLDAFITTGLFANTTTPTAPSIVFKPEVFTTHTPETRQTYKPENKQEFEA